MTESFDVNALGLADSNINWDSTAPAVFVQSSGRFMGGTRTSTNAINNEVVFRLAQPLNGVDCTWDLVLLHQQNTARGVYTVSVSTDDTTYTDVGTIDGYAAASTAKRSVLAGVTIPDGTQFVRLKMAGKNASSTQYIGDIQYLGGVRRPF